MKCFILGLLVLSSVSLSAQSYEDSVKQWQHHYKQEFVAEPHSPLKAADTGFIRFYPVGKRWRAVAQLVMTPSAKPFNMATHSGKTKKFRQFALLRFVNPASRGLKFYQLAAYERIDPPAGDTISRTTLFIPFNDRTNGEKTYGGGRYLDIPRSAITNGHLILDFNKAYNPYCAYAEGYSCPIPPAENNLKIAVQAGEMIWTKKSANE